MGKAGKVLLGVGIAVAGVVLAPLTGGASLALTSLGLGMASRQLFGPAALANRSSEIRQNLANPLADLPIVYGTAKVGLKFVDIRTGVSNPKKLYIVGAVCAQWLAPDGITITQLMVRLFRSGSADHCVGRIRRQESSGFTTLATTAEPTAGSTQDKTASLSEAVTNTKGLHPRGPACPGLSRLQCEGGVRRGHLSDGELRGFLLRRTHGTQGLSDAGRMNKRTVRRDRARPLVGSTSTHSPPGGGR
jgi:hypothetical protein